MAKSFSLDTRGLSVLLQRSPQAVGKGARRALDDIKDDWVKEARDIAPLDTSNLRKQIQGELEGQALNTSVVVTANAKQDGFNYGYYIHELDAGGRNLRTPGTEKQFLDKSADEEKWQRWLEEEVLEELEGEGW
ncbi:hypothetical protein [Bacillus sp. JJ722]|uniref:hypothetical protein n=1 Tax=Bacillus sp. JJ722 TaxID=3122973 RepID=UPI003000623E